MADEIGIHDDGVYSAMIESIIIERQGEKA